MKIRSLKSCDTCRKAIKWLKENGVEPTVLDIRDHPPTRDEVAGYAAKVGWDKLLNRKSTTWRQLADEDKTDLDEDKAVGLLVAYPTLMKRPVFMISDQIVVGFDKAARTEMESFVKGG